MAANYTVTPAQGHLRCYAKAVKQEHLHDNTRELVQRFSLSHPKIDRYKARLLGWHADSDEYGAWTGFLVDKYGPQRTCLSLGSGTGRVEQHLLESGFASQFDAIEISDSLNAEVDRSGSNIDARQGDLNFCELPANTYDFILCHQILHHLINIEHVLDQINNALAPSGLLLVSEYIGENRWQFNEDRLSYLRNAFSDIPLKRVPPWRVDGFESIRSADVRHLLKAQFGNSCEQSVDFGGAYFPYAVSSWSRAMPFIDQILEQDEIVSKQNMLNPCYHIGLYRKSNAPPVEATPWTDDDLRLRLTPEVSGIEHVHKLAYYLRKRVRLRSRLYMLGVSLRRGKLRVAPELQRKDAPLIAGRGLRSPLGKIGRAKQKPEI
jgi:SAM-dependent methyltransferase